MGYFSARTESFLVLKKLNAFLKDNLEAFLEFDSCKEFIEEKWLEGIFKLYDRIESQYQDLEGISFADMEYLLVRALENSDVVDALNRSYQYFVIDEFQYTSWVQFKIIEDVIKSDYKKLFCIGDLKQAIYAFRGGEIGVFQYCLEKIPQKLTLNSNYRSTKDVIEFNNEFFDYVFNTGGDFVSKGISSFAVDKQKFPFDESSNEISPIDCLKLENSMELRECEKLKNKDIDLLEAEIITGEIIDSLNDYSSHCRRIFSDK